MKRTFATAAAATSLALALALSGCSGSALSGSASTVSASTETAFYDSSTVHSISVTFDEAEYDAMLQTYAESRDKEWISATVVIDGITYENVGLKLKGNSSLQGLSQALTSTDDEGSDTADTRGGMGGGMGSDLSPDEPEGLPWRIKLDEYVDGQNHDGESDFVVRGNNTETALNEAISLELLDAAGMATQQASATRFSVNGSEEELRLVVQNPDDQNWYEENIDDNGVLFKAESGGDYSYRGDDHTEYLDAFDLEANPEDLSDEEAYQPLIEFLDFTNNADDETFAAELGDYLDVDAFAEYLAIEDLLGNTDDIDGPGNNSYLAYDPDTGLFTVVAWDHNLTLSSGMGGGGGFGGAPGGDRGGMPGGGEMPEGFEPGDRGTPPEGFEPPQGGEMPEGFEPPNGMPEEGMPGGGAGGPGGQSNALSQRFQENNEFAALIDEASARLQSDLIDSGYASEVLQEWTTVLSEQASDLVSTETTQSESDSVAQALSGTSE